MNDWGDQIFDKWEGEWMNVWRIHEYENDWLDGWIYASTYICMIEWKIRWLTAWKDEQINKWMNEGIYKWMNVRMDE